MMKGRRRTRNKNKLSSRRTNRSGRSKSPRATSRHSGIFSDEDEEMDMQTKEKMIQVRNPLIWYFPQNFNKNEGKSDLLRDIFDKSKRTAGIRDKIKFGNYEQGALVQNAIKSADVKAPFSIKFHQIKHLSSCFSRADLTQLPPDQKRFFPLNEIKTKNVFDIKSILVK